MSRTPNSLRLLSALVLVASAAACSRRNASTDTTAVVATPAAPAAAVEVAAAPGAPVALTVATKPGEAVYLTDANGRAVYYIVTPDGKAIAQCTGECATAFDPVTGKAVVASGNSDVQVALIGDVARPDGRNQVTYAGKPLYYSRADQQPGDTKGQGVRTNGGQASLVGPDGKRAGPGSR